MKRAARRYFSFRGHIAAYRWSQPARATGREQSTLPCRLAGGDGGLRPCRRHGAFLERTLLAVFLHGRLGGLDAER